MNYVHLTADERYQIDDLQREGFSQAVIAKKIGRSRSTLWRELNRNKGDRGWRPRLILLPFSRHIEEEQKV